MNKRTKMFEDHLCVLLNDIAEYEKIVENLQFYFQYDMYHDEIELGKYKQVLFDLKNELKDIIQLRN